MEPIEYHEKIDYAARRIQAILIELEDDLGARIDHVAVDVREFANLAVEIFVKESAELRDRDP
jgi:hypothetical protein